MAPAALDLDRPRTRWGLLAVSLIGGAALWEIAGRHASETVWVPLSATVERLAELIRNGDFGAQLAQSALLFATGFLLALAVGLPAGLALARFARWRVALEDYIAALYATPMVALIPFILSLMGFGFAPKVLVVFLFGVFPILYNTIEGARSIRPELIEVARAFRSTELALWRDVMVPYSLPFAISGVRQAIGRALVGMVAAEFFLSSSGLGYLILSSARDFDTAAMLVAILTITVLGVVLMALGQQLEDRLGAWRGLGR